MTQDYENFVAGFKDIFATGDYLLCVNLANGQLSEYRDLLDWTTDYLEKLTPYATQRRPTKDKKKLLEGYVFRLENLLG